MLTITVKNKDHKNEKTYRFNQQTVLIGRQQDCDIILDSESVSRRHAQIKKTEQGYLVEDLGSGNGTNVGEQNLHRDETAELQNGAVIKIQDFEIHINPDGTDFQTDVSVSKTMNLSSEQIDFEPKQNLDSSKNDEMIEIQMIKKVLGALDQDKQPTLTVIDDEFKGLKVSFPDDLDELVIGRDNGCELQIPSHVISRRHAVLSRKWGSFVITDLKSKNSTYVNGEKIEEKTIMDGDEITFGTIKSIFKNPSQFDIEAFTKQLTEEKKQETAKLDQTGSFDLSQFKNDDKQVSSAAQATQEANESKQTKPESQSTKDLQKKLKDESKTQTNDSTDDLDQNVDDLLDDQNQNTLTQKQSPSQQDPKSSLATSLSTTEKALLGFGAFVFISLLVGLAALFLF